MSEGLPFIHRSVDVDDKTNDVLVKAINNTVAAFPKYRNDASSSVIEKAVDALATTYNANRRIEFFGVGNSGIVGHIQVMSASLLGPGDCVVVVSNSGRTRDLMDACDVARKNGATAIVIAATGSPLANITPRPGNIHLAADHPEDLKIIHILATCLALRIGAKLQPLLKEMKNNLRNKRYA